MAGHSKRHNIKHRKAATDAVKAKVYTKVAKIIEMAARHGADANLNPSLQTALDKARYHSVPKEIIERAIKKGSGQNSGENLEEIYYEGYGPAGIALYIKCITSNKNRTASNIRATLTKAGGNMGEPGSVSWQFNEKGLIYVTGKIKIETIKGKQVENIEKLDVNQLEEVILEAEVDNYEILEEGANIYTTKENFSSVTKFLEENHYKIESADIQYIPENYMDLSEEEFTRLEKLIELLEEDDDVDSIYHNG